MQINNIQQLTTESCCQQPTLSKYALRSPLMRLPADRRRARSCSAGVRSRAEVRLMFAMRDTLVKDSQSQEVSSEEDDFKFLDNFVKEREETAEDESSSQNETQIVTEKVRENRVAKIKKQIVMNSPRFLRKFKSFPNSKEGRKEYEGHCSISSQSNLSRSRKMSAESSSFTSDMSTASSGSSCSDSSETSEVPLVLKQNIHKLEELAQDFRHMNTSLSKIVAEEQHLLQNTEDLEVANLRRIGYLNLSAHTNIQRACLAFLDYRCAVEEFDRVLKLEEALILDKAIELNIESRSMFTKVESRAVYRLRSSDEDETLLSSS